MAHYKQNNNSNFIPQKNVKKKKKFTTSQLIVFILMCFWTICSIIGCFGFGLSVAKADTTGDPQLDEKLAVSKETDLPRIYESLDLQNSPSYNILDTTNMRNDTFALDHSNPNYSDYYIAYSFTYDKVNGPFLNYSEWYYFPFLISAGKTYTLTLDDFTGGPNASRLQLQLRYTNGSVESINIDNASVTPVDKSITFTTTRTVWSCRFICWSGYESAYFTFANPRINFGSNSQPYSPSIEFIVNYIYDNAFVSGWDWYKFDLDDISYEKGYNQAVQDFLNDFSGEANLGVLSDTSIIVECFSSSGENRTFNVSTSSVSTTNSLNFNDYLFNKKGIVGFTPNRIIVSISFNNSFLYQTNALFSFNYPDKPFRLLGYYDDDVNTQQGLELYTSINAPSGYQNSFIPLNVGEYFQLQGIDITLNDFGGDNYMSNYLPLLNVTKLIVEFSASENAQIFNYNLLSGTSFNYGYNMGYDQATNELLNSQGYLEAINQAKEEGRRLGYNQGVEAANEYTFLGLMGSVIDAPLNAVINMFDFDLLGFNMKSFYLALITASLIIVIIKRII